LNFENHCLNWPNKQLVGGFGQNHRAKHEYDAHYKRGNYAKQGLELGDVSQVVNGQKVNIIFLEADKFLLGKPQRVWVRHAVPVGRASHRQNQRRLIKLGLLDHEALEGAPKVV